MDQRTNRNFARTLQTILTEYQGHELLCVPGVYEAVAKYFEAEVEHRQAQERNQAA